jgi:GDP-L-fucose synthase
MKRLFITGHRGMVGSALVREAARRDGVETLVASREVVDLCDQAAVFGFLAGYRPEIVIVAAAKAK